MQRDPTPDLPLADSGKAAPVPPHRPNAFLRLRLWRLPALMAVLFTGAVIGMYFQPPALRAFFGLTGLKPGAGASAPIAVPSQAPPVEIPHPPTVAALGKLIPDGDLVTLALPFGAADARVARLVVHEGDRVTSGQTVADLDSLPQLHALVQTAQASLSAREASLAQTRANTAASLIEATAYRDRAAAAQTLAASELTRIADLAKRGVATQSQLDQATSAADQAARELDRTEAALTRYQGAETGTQPDILLAERNIDVARADLARATQDLAKGTVVAATPGTILKLHVRAGEKVGAAGVATLGNTDQMRAELEVYQTDIHRIALGQSVELSADALGEAPLTGKIDRIGLEVERQSITASDPAANTDARIVKVEVALDAASSPRAAALSGLDVLARISVGSAP